MSVCLSVWASKKALEVRQVTAEKTDKGRAGRMSVGGTPVHRRYALPWEKTAAGEMHTGYVPFRFGITWAVTVDLTKKLSMSCQPVRE